MNNEEIKQEEEIQQEDKKKKYVKRGVFATVVILLLLLLTKSCTTTDGGFKNPFDKEAGDDIVDIKPGDIEQENIEVSFRTEYLVNASQPIVQMVNPAVNNVYMQFSVEVDGQQVVESGLISPGKARNLELHTMLSPGEYNMNVRIRTFDLTTEQECSTIPVNGIKIIVQ